MKQEELARIIGLSAPAVSGIENNSPKNGPNPQLIIRIADALECESILYKYIEDNPVYKAIIPKVFPDLNNIRTEPAVIFNKVAREADEARLAALELGEMFSNADPRRAPDFDSRFKFNMQQIIDIKRCVEILETQLIASHIINQSGLRQIYAEQQAKCEANGHHIPEQRTGTEG
jgi:transcriptional regulator with XRE-family HTH domain